MVRKRPLVPTIRFEDCEYVCVHRDPLLLPRLAETASFANLKQNAENFVRGADRDVWHDSSSFFNVRTGGQRRDVITGKDERVFQETLGMLLRPDAASWLLDGNGSGAP